MARDERGLALLFCAFFFERFERECEDFRDSMIPKWEESKLWTKFMLDPEQGLLARVANDWSQRTFNRNCNTKSEWHKFDLMLVDCKAGSDWWMSVPLVTIEHENGDGIQDEVWKLACWTSRLKVLMTYHDTPRKAGDKRARAASIINNIHPDGDAAEWLFLSAPRTWGRKLDWEAHEWGNSDWVEIKP